MSHEANWRQECRTISNIATGQDIVVVGAGAAGLLAAKYAAENGARVVLLEKNPRPGMKILISGGGKCNLTHAGEMEALRATFRTNEARFLKPAFYRYSNQDFLSLLHNAGVETYVRPDGRVFPVEPTNAKDIVATLNQIVVNSGARLITQSPVDEIVADERGVVGVRVGTTTWEASKVIVAVGGSSYPATGTTGDGWRWISDLGHSITPLRAALAPLYLDQVESDWSGIALRDVVLRARLSAEGKEYARWRGDLLFTHKGISGPCALGISREVAEKMAAGTPNGGSIEVDLVPSIGFEALQAELKTILGNYPRRTIGSMVEPYLPERIRNPFLSRLGIDPHSRGSHFASKSLNRLIGSLKGWVLGGVRAVPLEKGEVVAGGVSLEEVHPQTMESVLIRGLYLCGEILDIAGDVGGYNLQAAWSTGFVAGVEASRALRV